MHDSKSLLMGKIDLRGEVGILMANPNLHDLTHFELRLGKLSCVVSGLKWGLYRHQMCNSGSLGIS